MSGGDKTENVTDNRTVLTSPTPSPSPLPKSTVVKPTPTLTVEIIGSYGYWADILDPIDRRMVLDKDCASIAPSQVAYPNNVQVMLDNTASSEARVLKIGTTAYSLDAYEWRLVNLSSNNLPAKLVMFCGSMELGQVELE